MSTFGGILKHINDALERDTNNELRSEGITLTQSNIITELDQREDKTATLKELEKCFEVAQPTMVGIVKRLEAKGLVCTRSEVAGKRIKVVTLTDEGEKKCREAYHYMSVTEDKITAELSLEEQKVLMQLLQKVHHSLR